MIPCNLPVQGRPRLWSPVFLRLFVWPFGLLLAWSAWGQEDRVLYLPDSVALHVRFIPAGTFTMGSPEDEEGRDGDEGPRVERSIESGFYLGTYEVTQRQWLAVMHHNPAAFQQLPDHLNQPVERVSWAAAQRFLEKLNKLEIGTFRLPSEAEWEYACRAGTTSRFYWGAEGDWTVHQHAWANSRSFATTHPVGEKPANPWGLYDMAGNVWEWTSTPYQPYGGPGGGPDSLKVFRGGSWFDFAPAHRCANRHKHGPAGKYSAIGLRLVWEPHE